jgi:hypothetical protein
LLVAEKKKVRRARLHRKKVRRKTEDRRGRGREEERNAHLKDCATNA